MISDRDELNALLDVLCRATLRISQVEDLPITLQQIADTARELISADYAVLAVFAGENRPERFIFSGVDQFTADSIGHQPEGIGLLGAVSKEQRTFRLAQIMSHPQFSGFPSGHPEMDSFLGMPIEKDGVIYGRIYLANKLDNQEFSSTDEQLLQIFAAHAAVAIQNAQLVDTNKRQRQLLERRNRHLAALDQATMAISGELTVDKVLQQIVDTARELANAQYAALGVPNKQGSLENFVDSGMEPEIKAQIAHQPQGLGLLGAIIKERKTICIPKIEDDPRSVGFPPGHPPMASFLGVPIVAGGEMLGNLYLSNKLDANEFSRLDQELVELLAAHAAVAIQNARLYGQVGRLAIVEERTRIGMDLHDGIIQSIFAVGLMLESTKLAMHKNLEEADSLLTDAIEGLNDTIRDIRNFILDLRPHRFQGNLEQGLGRLVREFQANTMVAVSFSASQEVLTDLPASVARSLFLTTQEALANIARHAHAKQVFITIEERKSDHSVVLQVEDDGRGFDMAAKSYSIGHGLSNMRARAEDLNGSFLVQSTPGKGTTIKLTFPC